MSLHILNHFQLVRVMKLQISLYGSRCMDTTIIPLYMCVVLPKLMLQRMSLYAGELQLSLLKLRGQTVTIAPCNEDVIEGVKRLVIQ